MRNINPHQCPVCGEEIHGEIAEDRCDSIYVSCESCGVFAMSREFFEDYICKENAEIQRKRIATFLSSHNTDTLHPFLSEGTVTPPDGYRCYPCFLVLSTTRRNAPDK